VLYTRPQLRLLVALAATLLVGLGVREWRAGFPALADRLERFDRDERPADAGPEALAAGRPAGAARPRPAPETPLDLNRAGVAELARLPGVGPSLARRIVQERERAGDFDSPEALRRVYGLGPRKLDALRGLVAAGRPDRYAAPAVPDAAMGSGRADDHAESGSDGADDPGGIPSVPD
jgi:competence ComEA-like helix-hairpin-helix protein